MMSCSDSWIEQNGASPLVLADRVQLVAAAGQDLVRVGLVADVPEDLVARGVEQRVQRDRDLAGAEVGAEVAADLADGVDDVLAHLLGDRLKLLVAEPVQVLGLVDRVRVGRVISSVRVAMKSVICSSSGAASGAAWASAARARSMRLGGQLARAVETELGHVGPLAQPLVASLRLAERLC